VGSSGGQLATATGESIEIPSGILDQSYTVQIAQTTEEVVRREVAQDVPYDGAVTIDIADATVAKSLLPYAAIIASRITVALRRAIVPGTLLDVYRVMQPGLVMLLDQKASITSGGRAEFETPFFKGSFIVREHDDHSIGSIDLDGYSQTESKRDYNRPWEPMFEPRLEKIDGSGSVPIVFIHGASAYKNEDYARWGNFIRWAQNGNLDLMDDFQLWWFLHDSNGPPVGYYEGSEQSLFDYVSNVREFADLVQSTGIPVPFIIVAHSRGGLVARTYLEKIPGALDTVIGAITLASPHHGSPLAVPDWTYKTISRIGVSISEDSSVAALLVDFTLVLTSKEFDWRLNGNADLAWDDYDNDTFGIPNTTFFQDTILAGIPRSIHHLSPNDAGLPFNSSLDDNDNHLPVEYSRSSGSTLYELSRVSPAVAEKLYAYGGYFKASFGEARDSILGAIRKDEDKQQKLANYLMQLYENDEAADPIFAANDGLVPLQSALFLESDISPLYTVSQAPGDLPTADIARMRDLETMSQLPPGHIRYIEFKDYNHREMVEGKDGDPTLFLTIKEDLERMVASYNPVQGQIPMVSVPAGTFSMGSTAGYSNELPVHSVTLSSYWISKYEITQAQYAEVTGSSPSYFTGDTSRPVEEVTWYDAVEFCNKLSSAEGYSQVYTITGRSPATGYPIASAAVSVDWTKNGYRLPTEAEWEYAARGGSRGQGYTYSGSNDVGTVAWYGNNSGCTTHAVGGKAPNELGLYDMSGNVWEWCWDWYGSYSSSSQTDPRGLDSGSVRVLRGGSWNDNRYYCRAAVRGYDVPYNRIIYVGFRVVRSSP
jgi:sulfatase modifying factor 1